MATSVIAFCSQHGGTGQTLAISSLAWILASNGFRVLAVDWNFDSPGLHRYFRPFLADPALRDSSGLLDLFLSAAASKTADGAIDLETFTLRAKPTFRSGGFIALIPAGRQDAGYADRVAAFKAERFVQKDRGHVIMRTLEKSFRRNYDYVLIDTAAGVSEAADACCFVAADAMVIPFTLTRESIFASVAAAATVQQARGSSLRIFPFPSRVENAEMSLREDAIGVARKAFSPFLKHLNPSKYWVEVETPYISFYAYNEVIAPIKDDPGSSRGLSTSYERLAWWLTDGAVSSAQPETVATRTRLYEAYGTGDEAPRAPALRDLEPAPGYFLVGLLSAIRRNRVVAASVAALLFGAVSVVTLQYFVERKLYPYAWLSDAGARCNSVTIDPQTFQEALAKNLNATPDVSKETLSAVQNAFSVAVSASRSCALRYDQSSPAPKPSEKPAAPPRQ